MGLREDASSEFGGVDYNLQDIELELNFEMGGSH
jgi:hypothetical protein